jgi:hypothetical protein
LIVSSFAQQYGIRLYYEYETIPCEEFRQLLSGLNGETPLGYVVQIRSENDLKKINNMTKHEKEIREKWANYNNKNRKNERKKIKKEDISKIFSKIFG